MGSAAVTAAGWQMVWPLEWLVTGVLAALLAAGVIGWHAANLLRAPPPDEYTFVPIRKRESFWGIALGIALAALAWHLLHTYLLLIHRP